MPGGSLFQPTPSAKSIEDIMLDAQGLVSQTFDRENSGGGGTILIDGSVYFGLMPFRAGQVINNLSILITTQATTMSIGKLGLYDLSGNLLASTASQTTAWESTGVKTAALTAAYTIPSTGAYYGAVFAKASTLPTMLRNLAGSGSAGLAVGSGARVIALQATQTDLPSTATFAASALGFWIAAS